MCDAEVARSSSVGAARPHRAEVAARTLSDSAARGHSRRAHGRLPCVDRMAGQLLDRGTVRGLDTSCVAAPTLAPFVVSQAAARRE